MLTNEQKENPSIFFRGEKLKDNCFSQLAVNIIAAILDGNGHVSSAAGYHSDRFATIAAQRKQECVEVFVICVDTLNDVFLSFLRLCQCHKNHLISENIISLC